MSVLTIVEASKQFNVTRPRIYRAIQKGELTTSLNDEGVQVVQVRSSVRTEMAVFLGEQSIGEHASEHRKASIKWLPKFWLPM